MIVFGGGPSGLMAAWAATQAGYAVDAILDAQARPPDGTTSGVYYLHAACDLPIPSQEVWVTSSGTKQQYAQKVYGDPKAPCSFPATPHSVTAHDGMAAMRYLWHTFRGKVERARVEHLDHMAHLAHGKLAINTIPLNVLTGVDYLHSTAYCLVLETDAEGAFVHYAGAPGLPYYRHSVVFGTEAYEYPADKAERVLWEEQRRRFAWAHPVVKVEPDRRAMDAIVRMPPNIMFTGRYGAWSKRTLTHNVYYDTRKWLESRRDD